MTIEETLSSIDTSIKLIVTILQSAGAISEQAGPASNAGAPDAAKTTRTRTKKEDAAPAPAPVVAGDPAGTIYFVSDELLTVYAQTPGNPAPEPASFKQVAAAEYTAKKEEFTKKSGAQAAPSTAAAASPAANTLAASTASSVDSAPTWKDCLTAIQALNKSDKPGHGRDGVMAVLKQFGLEGQKVPALEGLNKHAEILKFTNDLLAGGAQDDSDLGI